MTCDVVVRRDPPLACGAVKQPGKPFCWSHWIGLPVALRQEETQHRADRAAVAYISALTQCYVYLNTPVDGWAAI